MIEFPSSWAQYKFADFALVNPKVQLKKDKSYPFIPMNKLSPNLKYVEAQEQKEFSSGGSKFENGDTLFARITPCLQNGKIAQCKLADAQKGFGSTEYFIFRGKPGVSDNDFVYYLSKTSWFQQNAINSMVGASGRQRADATFVGNTELTLPSLELQEKIAALLNTYDDLIENNLRRIELLEELVQITYEEWFVRLQYPGSKNTEVSVEPVVPNGWLEWDLKDFITIKHGYAYKGEFFCEEETNRILLTPGNVKIGGGLKTDKLKFYDETADNPEDYILTKHDLLVTMTDLSKMADTLGYPLLVPSSSSKTYLHNQRLGKVLPNNGCSFPKYFLYMLFQDDNYRGTVVGSASGATVKHTSPERILAYKPTLPPFDSELIKNFDKFAEPIFDVIDKLLQKNELLSEVRDLLLPRLMTGMVDIEKIDLPEALFQGLEKLNVSCEDNVT